VTLDNVSSNTSTMTNFVPKFVGYLASNHEPVDNGDKDRDKALRGLLHQRCACHIINLIVKSSLKRIKVSLEALGLQFPF
jgi:hypothetical protein